MAREVQSISSERQSRSKGIWLSNHKSVEDIQNQTESLIFIAAILLQEFMKYKIHSI